VTTNSYRLREALRYAERGMVGVPRVALLAWMARNTTGGTE
jgi:hypothetical protein